MCGIIAVPLLYGIKDKSICHRGPDNTIEKIVDDYNFTFHRLAIMDTSCLGNQPFENENWVLMCNGEIFNHKSLHESYSYPYISTSDCEVLLALLGQHTVAEICHIIDAEFAFVIYDKRKKKILAARDPIGIRPLFYGYCRNGEIAFASEMKALLKVCNKILPFPPGHYYDGENIKPYLELYKSNNVKHQDIPDILKNIREILIKSVVKRLNADVPIGFLLSGGLDSSLVCAIAAKYLTSPIETFAIGFFRDPIDLKYARQIADYLGSHHHEVIFNQEDIYSALKTVIWTIESWDVTTIRASIPMYLLCKYIRSKTSIRVVLSGEVSDELFGYKYTDFAPNASEFQCEAEKRIKELYMYDLLRADRCIAANSLEARVPFSDKEFVSYVMNINPELKLNKHNMGKYLLRKAFDSSGYLPEQILWRDKAAFSDAVGHGMVDALTNLAENKYSDNQFQQKIKEYDKNPPLTKEGLMYREIFREMFPNQDHVITGYWLPNPKWPNCNLIDPSARYLPNYEGSAN